MPVGGPIHGPADRASREGPVVADTVEGLTRGPRWCAGASPAALVADVLLAGDVGGCQSPLASWHS